MDRIDDGVPTTNYVEVVEGDERMFHCQLCMDFKRNELTSVNMHVKKYHFNHSFQQDGWRMFLCKRGCYKGIHYHCYHCEELFYRKDRFQKHLANILGSSLSASLAIPSAETTTVTQAVPLTTISSEAVVRTSTTTAIAATDSTTTAKPSAAVTKKMKCPVCNLEVTKKHYKTHYYNKHVKEGEKGISRERYHHGSCIDVDNGIFLVSGTLKGVQHLVHVQKYTMGSKSTSMFCESKACEHVNAAVGILGKTSFECDHLLSVQYLKSSEPVHLHGSTLEYLVQCKRIQKSSKEYCLKIKHEAESWNHVLVNEMSACESYSDRYVFLSVWTGEIRYSSRLGRVIIKFDRETFDIVCHCTDKSIGCQHKSIAKWFLCTVYPHYFDSYSVTDGDSTWASKSTAIHQKQRNMPREAFA